MQRSQRPSSFNKKQPVEDLRIKLNRKREEKGTDDGLENKKLPPPDPSYNFLKDALRGDNLEKSEQKFPPKFRRSFSDKKTNWRDEGNAEKRKVEPRQRKVTPEKREAPEPDSPQKPQPTIQQSSNIKIEVSSLNGARKCIVDETKVVQVPKVDEPYQRGERKPQREAQKLYVSKGKQRSQSFNENQPRRAPIEKEFQGGNNNRKRYPKREPRKENINAEEKQANGKLDRKKQPSKHVEKTQEEKFNNPKQEHPKLEEKKTNCDDI